MSKQAKNLNGAIKLLRFNYDTEPTPEAVMEEIHRGLQRVCKFSIKDEPVVYPSAAEAQWVNQVLTSQYMQWLDSVVVSARAYRCLVIDSAVYQVQQYHDKYNLIGTKTTLCVTGEQYHQLLAKSYNATELAREKEALRLATSAATHLWNETQGFPYFEHWSERIKLCENFTDRQEFSINNRLRTYGLAVQVATSPQIAAAVREYILAVLPGYSIPAIANTLQQVMEAAFNNPKNANVGLGHKSLAASASAPGSQTGQRGGSSAAGPAALPAPQLTGDQFQWQEIAHEYMRECIETCPETEMFASARIIYGAIVEKLEKLRISVLDKSYDVLSQFAVGEVPRVYSYLGPIRDWYGMMNLVGFAVDEIIADHEYFVTYEQDPETFDLVRKTEWLSIRALADEQGDDESNPIFSERVENPF